jgi:hypothetical protein
MDSAALVSNVERASADFGEPFERLQAIGQSLQNANEATGVLRRLTWFLTARKKLKALNQEERGGKEAAR